MDWKENWNEKVGLWSEKGPGHTAATKDLGTVHSGPNAASRLLGAAQLDALEEIDVERVLTALRDMQWVEKDATQGCIRWYREEDRPYDTNAAFFTGLSLILLRKLFYDQLDQQCCILLDEILLGLDVWFGNAVAHLSCHYPNKYLGDLVCKWMLLEITDRVDEDCLVSDHMRKAAVYWEEHNWGWGEHLSDGYAGVCLGELSVLLLLAERLPAALRKAYIELADTLLAIEDGFDGGGRVPALRSYAFQQPRMHLNYRDRVKPWKEAPRQFTNMPDLGNLLHGLGWHEAMPKRRPQPQQRGLTIPCFGGAVATARIESDIRLGSMSRFPIMPATEHLSWGLSWQCFPVAFSRGVSDWGFLQWETVEKGVLRAHPANGGPMAHIPKALSEEVMPPVFGQTFALQRGSGVLILRVMRILPKSWTSVTDRFRLAAPTAEIEETHRDGWSQLILRYPEREVIIHHVSLGETEKPELTANNSGKIDWDMTCDAPGLRERRIITHLWAISLNGPIETAPEVIEITEGSARSSRERVREIRWEWNDTLWKAVIDPLSSEPLIGV